MRSRNKILKESLITFQKATEKYGVECLKEELLTQISDGIRNLKEIDNNAFENSNLKAELLMHKKKYEKTQYQSILEMLNYHESRLPLVKDVLLKGIKDKNNKVIQDALEILKSSYYSLTDLAVTYADQKDYLNTKKSISLLIDVGDFLSEKMHYDCPHYLLIKKNITETNDYYGTLEMLAKKINIDQIKLSVINFLDKEELYGEYEREIAEEADYINSDRYRIRLLTDEEMEDLKNACENQEQKYDKDNNLDK